MTSSRCIRLYYRKRPANAKWRDVFGEAEGVRCLVHDTTYGPTADHVCQARFQFLKRLHGDSVVCPGDAVATRSWRSFAPTAIRRNAAPRPRTRGRTLEHSRADGPCAGTPGLLHTLRTPVRRESHARRSRAVQGRH